LPQLGARERRAQGRRGLPISNLMPACLTSRAYFPTSSRSSAAAAIGEHSAAVSAEAGFSKEEVESLLADAIVRA